MFGGSYFDGIDEDRKDWRIEGMGRLLWDTRELGDIVEWLSTGFIGRHHDNGLSTL